MTRLLKTSTLNHFSKLTAVVLLAATTLAFACGGDEPDPGPAAPTTDVRLYEGATLIIGNDSEPIEDGAFLVDDGVIVAMGQTGDLGLPPGAGRVDLSGKTIMPALVSLHGHLGYQNGLSYETENYTRQNIIDHLNRYAYYGVGTIVSMGTDAGSLAFEIRAEQTAGELGGARLLTAGRGLAMPNAGPGAAALRDSARGVTTEDEARDAVRELAAIDVDVVKIWVDDRNGNVEKLTPEIYRVIIEEAHVRDLQVIAHVFYAEDATDLVEAGVNGFAHLVRDEEMSPALVAAINSQNVFVMPNLGISERGTHDESPAWLEDPLLHDSITTEVLDRARESFSSRSAQAVARARESYANMERSVASLKAAGVDLVLGADSGVQDHFYGYTEIRELELMVAAGLTPNEAIVAATSLSARTLEIEGVGQLTAGRSADFIVLSANPLDDITNMRQIEQVFLKGVEVDREGLREQWTGR